MTAGNRTLGRVLLVLFGLVLLVGGIGTILVATVPQAASVWHDVGPAALWTFGSHADRATSVGSWTIALAAAVVVGIVALVVLGTRGGGRTDRVLDDDGVGAGMVADGAPAVPGAVRIDSTAVQNAISDAVGALPQVASLSVDVFVVKRRRSVRVRVRSKRGAEPRAIVDGVERIVADLDALLGTRLPVVLQIARGGGSAGSDRVR
jgi:hypothetical protein